MERSAADSFMPHNVWLPVRFDGETPYLERLDEWVLEEFEDA
jgi:hypothetical protein